MKIRIKTYNGELPSYLTVGKVYDVILKEIGITEFTGIFCDEIGFVCVKLDKCEHLNGGSWEVIS